MEKSVVRERGKLAPRGFDTQASNREGTAV
jgi:hypothetical protein